jgi:hypothetical protein
MDTWERLVAEVLQMLYNGELEMDWFFHARCSKVCKAWNIIVKYNLERRWANFWAQVARMNNFWALQSVEFRRKNEEKTDAVHQSYLRLFMPSDD